MNAKLVAQWAAAGLLIASGVTFASISYADHGGHVCNYCSLVEQTQQNWGTCKVFSSNDACCGTTDSQGNSSVKVSMATTSGAQTNCVDISDDNGCSEFSDGQNGGHDGTCYANTFCGPTSTFICHDCN